MSIEQNNTVTFVETNVAVGTSTGLLIAANPNRRFLMVCNPTANTIYITTLGTAALNAGIPIAPNGSYRESGATVPKNAFQAIAATGAVTVPVFEA